MPKLAKIGKIQWNARILNKGKKKLYKIEKFNEIQELNEGKKPSMKF